jgi:hypothetical protein
MEGTLRVKNCVFILYRIKIIKIIDFFKTNNFVVCLEVFLKKKKYN